jgi:hypothetical protein
VGEQGYTVAPLDRKKHRKPAKPKKKAANTMSKLTEGEQDLLSKMQKGYQLETDSLGGNPVLRSKDSEVIRPLSANASTVKALSERGLIHEVKGRDPLSILWRLSK